MARRSATRSSRTGAQANRLLAVSGRSESLKGRTLFAGGICGINLRAGRWLNIQAGANPRLRERDRSLATARRQCRSGSLCSFTLQAYATFAVQKANVEFLSERQIVSVVRGPIRDIYAESGAGKGGGWRSGGKKLARFADTRRLRYLDRGLRIPNGWNDPDERFRKGADKFWEATHALETL